MASNYDAHIGSDYERDSENSPRTDSERAQQKLGIIDEALKLRQSNDWDKRWSDFIKIYSNQYPYDELSGHEDKVVPNLIFSTVNVIVPSISIRSPKITVNARQSEDINAAAVAEAVVNHYWNDLGVQDQFLEAVKDFVVLGHGWMKVVWDSKVGERRLSPAEWQQAVQQALFQRAEAINSSSLSEDEFPTEQEVIESVPQTVEFLERDAPKATRVSPFDIIVDPDAKRIEDIRWIAQRSFVPLSEARENPNWNARVRRKLKGTVLSEARKDVDVVAGEDKPKDSAFVEVYEYYDILKGTVCVLAKGAKDFLMKPVESPFPEGHPFVFMENHTVPERFYPIGDVETVFALQLELAMTRTAMVNDRRAGRRIYMYRSSSIGPEGLEALESDEDRALLDVLDDRPFSDVLQSLSSTPLHPEWYAQSEQIISDINTVTGVSEYARGNMPDIRRTATEAGLIQDAANARSADKLAKIEGAMAEVAKRMIRLSQQYLDHEEVARVVSDDMVVDWVPFDRQGLQGEFVFQVEAGSTQPQNETFRRQSALQLMESVGQFFGTGLVNERKILEHVLRDGFGIRNAEEFLGMMEQIPTETGPEVANGLPPGVV